MAQRKQHRDPTLAARGRPHIGVVLQASLVVAVIATGLGMARPAAATGNSLRIDPTVQTVPQDGTFTARIVQRTDVPTSGAGATITFDPALLQIQSVVRGAPYAEAPVFSGASQVAITAANTTGSLVGVAAAFLPPDAVPAGEAEVFAITFKAIGCGTSELGLPTGVTDAALLDGREDSYGNTLEVSTVGGSVTTCNSPSASPSPSGGPSASPSPSGGPSPSPSASPSPTPSPTPPPSNSIRIEPASTNVAADATFSVRVVQNSEVPVGGITASVFFDPTILRVVSITTSAAYANAHLGRPGSDATSVIAEAIAASNTSGNLRLSAAFPVDPTTQAGDSVPAGDADFITVQLKAVACGRTPLLLPVGIDDSVLLDGRAATYQKPLAIRTIKGTVQVCEAPATPPPSQPTGNSIRLEPYSTLVIKDGGFSVRVVQRAGVPTSGNTTTIIFDPAMLQIVKITKAAAFETAPLFQGASEAAIAAANRNGKLNQVAGGFFPPANLPAGEADFVTVEFRSLACGESLLFVPDMASLTVLLDGRDATYGIPLEVSTLKAVVQACDPEARPTPKPTPTPVPTVAPTVAPVSGTPPTTVSGGENLPPPVEEPPAEEVPASPEPTTEPVTTPAPEPTIALVAALAPVDTGPPPLARDIAIVGLGLAGVIFALVIVGGMAAFLVTTFATPMLVMRLRALRRQR